MASKKKEELIRYQSFVGTWEEWVAFCEYQVELEFRYRLQEKQLTLARHYLHIALTSQDFWEAFLAAQEYEYCIIRSRGESTIPYRLRDLAVLKDFYEELKDRA